MVVEKMVQTDYTTFQRMVDMGTSELLEFTQSLRTFLFLLGTVLCYGSSAYTYTIEKVFTGSVKRFGLLGREMGELDGVPEGRYPVEVGDTVRLGMTNIPQLLGRTKECFEVSTLLALMGWVNLFAVRTLDNLYQLSDFCAAIVPALLEHRKNYM